MLTKITSDTFSQLKSIINQLDGHEYAQKVSILNYSSIGQHIRHVLEFYICLSEGLNNGHVNYDKRKRNLSIENDSNYALKVLEELSSVFCCEEIDDTILTHIIEFNGEEISSNSSVSRELVYLIEHSIHHYAIIAIALRNAFAHIRIPHNFGVAYSTTKYHEVAELTLEN